MLEGVFGLFQSFFQRKEAWSWSDENAIGVGAPRRFTCNEGRPRCQNGFGKSVPRDSAYWRSIAIRAWHIKSGKWATARTK